MVTEEAAETLPRRVAVSALLICVVLGAGAALFAGLKALREQPTRAATPPPRTAVRAIPAQRTDYQETLVGYGRARALRSAHVAAELGAAVVWVAPALEAGTAVAAGDVLVRLDPRDAASALRRSEANVARSKAEVTRLSSDAASLERQLEVAVNELASADRELDRFRKLADDGHATPSEVDNRSMAASLRRSAVVSLEGRRQAIVAQSAAAEASVAVAEADQGRAQDDLARAEVKAPFDGVIEARSVSPGDHVNPGAILFELVDLTRVEVPVSLPASRFGEVPVGAAASVRLGEGRAPVWTGTVARLAPVVDPTNRTFLAYLLVEGADGPCPVPPGAFVVVDVAGGRYEDVIVVPRAAFVGRTVFVAEPTEGDEAVVRERSPKVRRLLSDVALLDDGIDPGDRIVVTNVEQIAEGGRVRLVAEKPTDAEPGE